MSARRVVWVLLGLAVIAALAVAVISGGSGGESDAERAERLARGIRCPTCQGLSAAESDAKAANAVRAEVTRRVAQGQSDEAIRQALVDRYGREILLTPEGEGVAAVVWALPVAVLVIAGAGLALHLSLGRERADSSSPNPPAPVPPALGRRVAVVVGVIAVAVGAGVAVARMAGERLPGDSATGTVDLGPAELLVEARTHLADGRAVDALRLYDQVLEQDPNHPEALAYRGWLVRLAGEKQQGMDLVDTAIAADPNYPDAHLFKGVMLLEDRGQAEAAKAELTRFMSLDPDSPFTAQAQETLARAEAAAS